LDVSQAIPVGLIVNEAVTNSIKYAFSYPAHRPQISIALDQYEKQAITLTISDNGIGLPPSFDSSDTNGLGFKLMNGLVEDIEGRLTIESDEGTIIIVAFNGSVPFVEKTETPELVKAFAL
jgi:two-component sensor histidine kinase